MQLYPFAFAKLQPKRQPECNRATKSSVPCPTAGQNGQTARDHVEEVPRAECDLASWTRTIAPL